MLIIKDKEGYIYGGYASQPWERHADFYGDMKSFLFQLYPKASIYRPTGANNNIQWVSACVFFINVATLLVQVNVTKSSLLYAVVCCELQFR